MKTRLMVALLAAVLVAPAAFAQDVPPPTSQTPPAAPMEPMPPMEPMEPMEPMPPDWAVPSVAPAPVAPTEPMAGQRSGAPQMHRNAGTIRPDCMQYTGSRILSRSADRSGRQAVGRAANVALTPSVDRITQLGNDDCIAANGRVYSREDLERTGQIDIADALRRLDPAIR